MVPGEGNYGRLTPRESIKSVKKTVSIELPRNSAAVAEAARDEAAFNGFANFALMASKFRGGS